MVLLFDARCCHPHTPRLRPCERVGWHGASVGAVHVHREPVPGDGNPLGLLRPNRQALQRGCEGGFFHFLPIGYAAIPTALSLISVCDQLPASPGRLPRPADAHPVRQLGRDRIILPHTVRRSIAAGEEGGKPCKGKFEHIDPASGRHFSIGVKVDE